MRPALLACLLVACGSKDPVGPAPGDTAGPTGATEPTEADLSPLSLPRAGTTSNGRFATSDVCAECHDNAPGADAMRDAEGREIAPYHLWRSAMMANSARDPVWRAQVSAEVATTPAGAVAIEAKCLRCHAPMASADAELLGEDPPRMALLTERSERGDLARDGVSCTVCHQLEDRHLGEDAGFSGQYTVLGEGRIYGPHAEPFSMPMIQHTGFTPTLSSHLLDAGLCATCHVLEAHALGPDGAATGGSVVEQGTWLEWAASDAAAEATCQGCHLPTTDADGSPIATRIARSPMGGDFPPVTERSPFGRHLLVGGNTLVPRLLGRFRSVLEPAAPDEALDATLEAAREQLGERTATLAVLRPRREGDRVRAEVEVEPLTGHKLPTGIPVRRLWLQVTVTDADGAVVRELGAWDAAGRLLDERGAVLASDLAGGPLVPHLDTVTDLPQVWEAVLADDAGEPTWRLTRAAGWVKDDRLLPAGFDPASAEGSRVPPVGTGDDPDFLPGGDTVHLDLDVAGAAGPLTLTATLWFQPLSARWAAELVAADTPEARALEVMLDEVGNPPERVARQVAAVP